MNDLFSELLHCLLIVPYCIKSELIDIFLLSVKFCQYNRAGACSIPWFLALTP